MAISQAINAFAYLCILSTHRRVGLRPGMIKHHGVFLPYRQRNRNLFLRITKLSQFRLLIFGAIASSRHSLRYFCVSVCACASRGRDDSQSINCGDIQMEWCMHNKCLTNDGTIMLSVRIIRKVNLLALLRQRVTLFSCLGFYRAHTHIHWMLIIFLDEKICHRKIPREEWKWKWKIDFVHSKRITCHRLVRAVWLIQI